MKSPVEGHFAKLIKLLFGIMIILILGVLLLIDKRIAYSLNCTLVTAVPNMVIVLVLSVVLAIGLLIRRKVCFYGTIRQFCNLHFTGLLVCASILLLLLQSFISYHIYFISGWDVSIVTGYADQIANGSGIIGDYYYYSQYPHNIGITFVLALVQKFAYITGLEVQRYLVCIIFGCIQVTLAGIFTALSAKRLTKSGFTGLCTFLLFAFVAGLSPWITVPYSDVYSILYPAVTFYLYVRACDSPKHNWLWWFGIGLISGFGFYLKANSIIVLIAIVLMEGFKLIVRKKEEKVQILRRFLALVVALILIAGCHRLMLWYTQAQLNPDMQMTFTHYLMMGLNNRTTGSYDADDYHYSTSFPTVKERQQGNLSKAAQRIQDYGFLGYTQFLTKKLLTNFNDGTFSWWMEGSFQMQESRIQPTLATMRLRRLMWADGDWYLYYATAAQGLWLTTICFLLGNLLKCSTQMKEPVLVMCLSLLGIFAFVMLFEARGRYLFCLLPIFHLSAIYGLRTFVHSTDTHKGFS